MEIERGGTKLRPKQFSKNQPQWEGKEKEEIGELLTGSISSIISSEESRGMYSFLLNKVREVGGGGDRVVDNSVQSFLKNDSPSPLAESEMLQAHLNSIKLSVAELDSTDERELTLDSYLSTKGIHEIEERLERMQEKSSTQESLYGIMQVTGEPFIEEFLEFQKSKEEETTEKVVRAVGGNRISKETKEEIKKLMGSLHEQRETEALLAAEKCRAVLSAVYCPDSDPGREDKIKEAESLVGIETFRVITWQVEFIQTSLNGDAKFDEIEEKDIKNVCPRLRDKFKTNISPLQEEKMNNLYVEMLQEKKACHGHEGRKDVEDRVAKIVISTMDLLEDGKFTRETQTLKEYRETYPYVSEILRKKLKVKKETEAELQKEEKKEKEESKSLNEKAKDKIRELSKSLPKRIGAALWNKGQYAISGAVFALIEEEMHGHHNILGKKGDAIWKSHEFLGAQNSMDI